MVDSIRIQALILIFENVLCRMEHHFLELIPEKEEKRKTYTKV